MPKPDETREIFAERTAGDDSLVKAGLPRFFAFGPGNSSSGSVGADMEAGDPGQPTRRSTPCLLQLRSGFLQDKQVVLFAYNQFSGGVPFNGDVYGRLGGVKVNFPDGGYDGDEVSLGHDRTELAGADWWDWCYPQPEEIWALWGLGEVFYPIIHFGMPELDIGDVAQRIRVAGWNPGKGQWDQWYRGQLGINHGSISGTYGVWP